MKIHFRMSGTEFRNVCGLTPETRGGPGERHLEWWVHKGLASPSDGRDRLHSISIPVEKITAADFVHGGQAVEVCEVCVAGALEAPSFHIGAAPPAQAKKAFELPAVYGSPDGELHPDRSEVVLDAMHREAAGESTRADRVLLWFDTALNAALCALEEATR